MENGMGNSKERVIFIFGVASESEKQFASKNHKSLRCTYLSEMSIFF